MATTNTSSHTLKDRHGAHQYYDDDFSLTKALVLKLHSKHVNYIWFDYWLLVIMDTLCLTNMINLSFFLSLSAYYLMMIERCNALTY